VNIGSFRIVSDYNGSWQGETEFQPNQGMYLFNLYNFQGNQAVYTEWLKRMEADINRIRNLSKTFDLPQNLLIWAGYQHKVGVELNIGTMSDSCGDRFSHDSQSVN
jgi:hypothetical protein